MQCLTIRIPKIKCLKSKRIFELFIILVLQSCKVSVCLFFIFDLSPLACNPTRFLKSTDLIKRRTDLINNNNDKIMVLLSF